MNDVIEKLELLEADPAANYDELNSIYAEMLATNPESLRKYNFKYLMSFSSMYEHYKSLLKEKISEVESREYKLAYLFRLMAYSLCFYKLDEYNEIIKIRATMDISFASFGHDFLPISKLEVIEDDEYITFIADGQADQNVCRVLIKDISALVKQKFDKFFPKPKVFLLRGRGPSPCYTDQNCALMMIGHYQGIEYENTIFKTSIIHELTHLYRYSKHKLPINSENSGFYKFFDEGFAVQNSYDVLPEFEKYFVKFYNSAFMINKYSGFSTQDIVQKWQDFVFVSHYLPTYDYACAFVSYLDSRFAPLKCQDYFFAWVSQTEVKTADDYFALFYQISLIDVLQEWSDSLTDFEPNSIYTKSTKIFLIKDNSDFAEFEYESEFDLWAEQYIFCISAQGIMLEIKSNKLNPYRFQKNGKFILRKDDTQRFEVKDLQFVVLFKDTVEILHGSILETK
jgi:hypothetical protein